MRLALLACVLLLAAGCAAPAPDNNSPAPAPSPGNHGSDLTRVELATFSGPPGGGNIVVQSGKLPFDVKVPAGGAKNVHYTITTTGSTVPGATSLEGPGCGTTQDIGSIGIGNSIQGKCNDLPEGTTTFRLVTPAPTLGFTVEVYAYE